MPTGARQAARAKPQKATPAAPQRRAKGAGEAKRGAKPKKADYKNDALSRHLRSERIRERVWHYLLPGFVIQSGIILVLSIALAISMNREQDTIVVGLSQGVADSIPLRVIKSPLTPERVAFWCNDVFDRLFEFSYANKSTHFRKINIFFSAQGFAQFRRALVENNWIHELDLRRGVFSGELKTPIDSDARGQGHVATCRNSCGLPRCAGVRARAKHQESGRPCCAGRPRIAGNGAGRSISPDQ